MVKDGVLVAAEGEAEHIGLDVCQACNARVSPYFEPAMGIDREGNTVHQGRGNNDGPRGMKRMVRKCPKCHSVLGVTGDKPAPKAASAVEQFAAPLVGIPDLDSGPSARSEPCPGFTEVAKRNSEALRQMERQGLPAANPPQWLPLIQGQSASSVELHLNFETQAAVELAAVESQLVVLKSRAKALRKILGR